MPGCFVVVSVRAGMCHRTFNKDIVLHPQTQLLSIDLLVLFLFLVNSGIPHTWILGTVRRARSVCECILWVQVQIDRVENLYPIGLPEVLMAGCLLALNGNWCLCEWGKWQ